MENNTISTGLKKLDQLTQGFRKSSLIIIGARPAMGKTTFAVNLAENIALAGKKCAFFSLESSAEMLVKKFSIVNCDMEIYIDDTPAPTVSDMKQKVKDLKDVDCVVIDYLSLITPEIKRTYKMQEISGISYQLKQMAKELDAFVVCIVQIPEYEGKATLNNLRESSIGQDADVIMFLHRDEFTFDNLDDRDPSITKLIIAKNRYGDTGTIALKYDSKTKKFNEV